MNVYVIYKFQDFNDIKESLSALENTAGISLFYFHPSPLSHRWKSKAKEKIKSADVVCYFFNFDSAKNDSKNLKWEYDFACKHKKRVIVIDKNNRTDIVNELLEAEKKSHFFKNIFNCSYNEKDISLKPISFDQGKEHLVEQSSWNIENKLLIQDETDISKEVKNTYYSLLMQQYKVMVDTSEKLMQRRQETSNLYTTVCTALVALVGSAFALKNMYALCAIFFCVGVVSIIMSVNWRIALDSFNRNNEGKFAVLNEIEKKLPANMFDSEYRYNQSKGIKSFALREKLLPFVFNILGIIFVLLGITFLVLKCIGIDFFVNFN